MTAGFNIPEPSIPPGSVQRWAKVMMLRSGQWITRDMLTWRDAQGKRHEVPDPFGSDRPLNNHMTRCPTCFRWNCEKHNG